MPWIIFEKNQIRLWLIIVLITIFLIGLFWQLENSLKIESPATEQVIQGRVLYTINKGEGVISEYQIEISDDSTVFSLLEELAGKGNFEIKTTFYPEMGVFVESINGLKGGTDNKWWQYWVNGKLGEVAADKKQVKAKDIIEWRFEVPPEF
jgi:hypothetical protein